MHSTVTQVPLLHLCLYSQSEFEVQERPSPELSVSQSARHVSLVSPVSQILFPHLKLITSQSFGQLFASSPGSQKPSLHVLPTISSGVQSFGQDSYDSPPSQTAFPQVNKAVGTGGGELGGGETGGGETGGGETGGGGVAEGGELGGVEIEGFFSTAVQAKRKIRTIKKIREKIIFVQINLFFIFLKDFFVV